MTQVYKVIALFSEANHHIITSQVCLVWRLGVEGVFLNNQVYKVIELLSTQITISLLHTSVWCG